MKILFLTPWYPDRNNQNHGVFVRDQALTILQDHKVWVVCCKISYDSFAFSSLSIDHSEFQGLKESRIAVKQSLPVFNQLNFFLRASWETLKIAKKFKPDLIHGNIGYPGAFWSWIISTILNVPFVITEHTRITNNFRSLAHKQLTLFGFKRARKIIAVSQWHADEISAYVGKMPVVIHNVINFEKFPGITTIPETTEFQIGFLGNMDTPVKGLDILLHAISRVSGNFTLHIGGKGNYLNEYRGLAETLGISSKCIFYGGVSNEDVSNFMSKLHFFVSASRFETFGIAMVEALTCGLPVIATKSGGAREFITPENGLIVPVENADKLAEGINWMMKNYSVFDRQKIRSEILTKFSREIFLQKINRIYAEALSRK